MSDLTKHEDEILGLLEEECAEVIQAISKARRFNLAGEFKGVTNAAALLQEIGDVLTVMMVVVEKYDRLATPDGIEGAVRKKYAKLRRYVPHLLEGLPQDMPIK